jgi:hypothetical protein
MKTNHKEHREHGGGAKWSRSPAHSMRLTHVFFYYYFFFFFFFFFFLLFLCELGVICG